MFTPVKRQLKRKGQAMVEYALLVVSIAVVGAVATTMVGHKTADTMAIAAAIIPGAHTDDNIPIGVGQLMPTTTGADGSIILNATALAQVGGIDRYASIFGNSNPYISSFLVTPE